MFGYEDELKDKIEALQFQLKESEERLAETETALKKSQELARVYEKALEFYADSDNYEFVYEEMGEINGVPQGGDIERLIDIDDCELLEENDGSYYGPAGKRARQALAANTQKENK